MAHQEEAAFPRVLQPLVPVVAEKEINGIFVIVVGVHKLETNGNTNHRECTKQNVSNEKNLCLLLEELPIVIDSINVTPRHVIEVDQIVHPIQAKVIDLLG